MTTEELSTSNDKTILSDIPGASYIDIIGIIIVVLIIIGAYAFYRYAENKISTLTTENALLQVTEQTQTQTIADLQKAFQKSQQDLDALTKEYAAITSSTNQEVNNINSITTDNKSISDKQKEFNSDFNQSYTNLNKQTNPSTFIAKGK